MFFAVITRIDFDGMENHTPHVRSLAIVLVRPTREEATAAAIEWVDAQLKTARLSAGYDGKLWPQWETECGEVNQELANTRRHYT
jgi:hypothetical protein